MEKPTFQQRLAGFGKFLYNSEDGTVLGRSGRSWAEIGVFYIIYYACLASFFAATLAVFNSTLSSDSPKLQGSASLLKANPGMGFQPMPDTDTTLIYSTRDDQEEYIKSIEKVLKAYEDAADRGVNCSGINGLRKEATQPCNVDFAELTRECNKANGYGMNEGNQCVLLKLNKIYDWKPEIWSEEEVQKLESKKVSEAIKNKYTANQIWVDCHGENPADEDNLKKSKVKYFPSQGFPLAYYPYLKQKGYLSPLIFVKFIDLPKHLAYMIECKALAKNIKVDREEKEGSVHFELLID